MGQTIEFANLKIDIEESGDAVTYTFTGDVDENFRQESVPRVGNTKINLQLADVSNFNSCGIREWIFLIKDLSELGSLYFHNCSVTMIDQINMVPDSLGNGQIISFFAPYFCEEHGEINQLIDMETFKSTITLRQAPDFKCPQCSRDLEFDALEESYFLFTDSGVPQAS